MPTEGWIWPGEEDAMACRGRYYGLQRKILWPAKEDTMACRGRYYGLQRKIRRDALILRLRGLYPDQLSRNNDFS
jgi:hypothetical protein